MPAILALLGLAMASALLVQYLPVPYTVVLVVLGLVLNATGVSFSLQLDRDLIVQVFLPLLLFEAALHVDLAVLRDTIVPIVLLALPGVALSTLLIAMVLHWGIDLDVRTAALFGALASATDPVAVLAIFKRLQVPERLAMLVEGESVLNDGTALVLFALLLPAAQHPSQSVQVAHLILQFMLVLAGGVAVGAACGYLAERVAALLTDHLAELTLSALLAYGSFLAGQRLGVSGVVAVVTAGLVFVQRSPRGLTTPARDLLRDVWEFAAFIANSLLFLLVGLSVGVHEFSGLWGELAWAVVAMTGARAVVVFGFGLLLRLRGRPFVWQHAPLVFWSGLRGGLGIALALSLPLDYSGRPLLLRLTSGIVLFTLLVQGLTLEPLLRWSRGRSSWIS